MAKDGPKHHHTDDDRANAVARVLAGESRRKVAADCGVAEGTVRRWMKAAGRRETAREKTLADKAQALAGDLQKRQEEVRAKLLERIDALIPDTDSLRDVAWAYGVVTDKVLLSQGKPTQIVEGRDQMDFEIEKLLAEEAAKSK